MSFVKYCNVGSRAKKLMMESGIAIALALVPGNDLFAQSADNTGDRKNTAIEAKSRKPGRERDLSAQRAAEKEANTAAKIDAARFSVVSGDAEPAGDNPCSSVPKIKEAADNRRVKARSREVLAQQRAAAVGRLPKIKKIDCPEEPAVNNATNPQDKNAPAGGKKIAVERRIQKPGRERDLSQQQAADKKANSAAKTETERSSAGAFRVSGAIDDPCATGPEAKEGAPRRLQKKRNSGARENQDANETVGSKLKIKPADCPEEPAGKNVENDNSPDGEKNGPFAKPPIARRSIEGNEEPQSASASDKPVDVCGDPNRIAVLTPQEAQVHRNQLNSVLSKSGFSNAGVGQRVPLRWYFNLPFRTTVADMVGKRAAPVNDTAVLTKIMGFSTDCNVITAFSKDTQNAQPVIAPYDVNVEFKKTDSDEFQSLGSFFKGAPASIFTKPGIFKLTATARGKLSPFKIGPVTHVIRVDSAALKRPFGITQLLIRNPGNVTGTAFSIGSKKSAETDAKRHCKSYQFTAFARSGKIISESSSTIQTSRPSNKLYNKASFDLFQDGKLLDQQGPSPFYNFDAKKFGDGNYVLKAKIAREDQGPGPKNFQVPGTQHVISVFKCGVINAPQIADNRGTGAKNDPKPKPPKESGGIGEGGDIPGVIIHELEDGEVIIDVLPPERFLKKAKAPTVAGPFLGSCEECKREIRRRHKVQARSCDALVGSMQRLILNVPTYNQLEIDYEKIFKEKILAPLAEFRAPQKEFQSVMRVFIEKAAKADVLQTKEAQKAHQQALAKVAERDRKRLAKNPTNQLSIPLIIQDDLPGEIGTKIFAVLVFQVELVKKFRAEFVKINTAFNDTSKDSREKAVEFVAEELPAALEEMQKLLDQMAEMRKQHLQIQAGIAGTFASKSHEHCLGTPRGSKSVVASVDGAANFTEVDGIPGMNVTLNEHPDNRPTKDEFLAAAAIDPPKDQGFEGLANFVPLKFKFDGIAYRNFENDFKRRFRELNGFFFTRAAAFGGTIQTIKKVGKIVAGAVADFAVAQVKTALNIGTSGLLFEEAAKKNLGNLADFFGKKLPRGFDILVGTDLAALINEENRVKQSDKFNGVKVLQNIAGLGVGQLAEVIGKGFVENVIAAAEARDLAVNGELSGNFADEIEQQDKINKGVGAGIVVALDLFGGKAFQVGAKFIKFGGKTFKTVDKAVDAANARRLKLGKKPLTPKQIAKFREAQTYATKANELIAKIRVDQKARLLARAADRARKLDELVDLSKNNNLTDEILNVVTGKADDIVPPVNTLDDIVPPVKGVDDVVLPVKVAKLDDAVPPKKVIDDAVPPKGVDEVVPPKKVADGDVPPKKVADGEVPPKKVADGDVPPKKVADGDVPPKKVADGEVPPKKVVDDDVVPPKPVQRRVKEPNRNPKQPRRGSKEARARDAEELARKNADQQPPKNVDDKTPPKKDVDAPDKPDVDQDVEDLFADLGNKPERPDVSGDDFFKGLDDGPPKGGNAVDDLFNKPPLNIVDDAAEEALKQARAREKLKNALIRRNNARNAGEIKPAKVGKVIEDEVVLPKGKADSINNPKAGETLGSGKTTTAVKLDPKNPDSDVLKAFDKKSAADSKVLVDDQIAGAKKLKDADVNFLDIKGRGKVDIDTQIADGNGKLSGPKVKRTNEFLIQEQLPKDAIELEVLIDGRKAAGIKPLLSEAEQIEILRQFNKTSDAGLVVRDTNLGNIAAKADGEAIFIESGSVIDAPNPLAARKAQAEHLFGEGDRIDVNQRTAKIFEDAGDSATGTQIKLNGPKAGASGTGGQGGFKNLISKDLQEAFGDPKAFQKILDDFDAKKLAKAETPPVGIVDDVVPPKGKGKKPPKDGDGGTPPNDGDGSPTGNNGGNGNQPPKGDANGNSPPVNPDVDKGVADLFADLNKRPDKPNVSGDDFFKSIDDTPPVKNANEAADEVANRIRREAEKAAKNAKLIDNVQGKFATAKGAKPAKVGEISEQTIKLSEKTKKAFRNPATAERVGSGQSTTALKFDPKNPDGDILKPFDKASAEQSKIIVNDQIKGAKDLKDADVNFLDIKGRGTVEVDTPITFGKNQTGDVRVKRTNDFLVQERLPSDAVELQDLVDARKAAGIIPVLTAKEQVEILRQFHKTSKKGLLLTDTNLGNIAAKANGESLFIESGSVVKLSDSAASAAREAQIIRLFGIGDVGPNLLQTARVIRKAGDKKLAAAIINGSAEAVGSGIGGQGAFAKLIDPKLQKKFANADEFDAFLKKFDADESLKNNRLVQTAPDGTAKEFAKLNDELANRNEIAKNAKDKLARDFEKLTPLEIRDTRNAIKELEDTAGAVQERIRARTQQNLPQAFERFKPGKVDDKLVEFPNDRLKALNNPQKGDAFGRGQTTTALKLDPNDPNTSVIKAFDQLREQKSGAGSKRIVDDQIAGAKDLEDAGANFLAIEGRGTVKFTQSREIVKDGKFVTRSREVEHSFLIQKQLPKDAVELGNIVDGGTATGLDFKDVLDEAQQIEILRQFHLTSKKGLVLRDTNLGNIAIKADGEAVFVESGSIIKIAKSGVVDPDLARKAQAEHIFGTKGKKLFKEKASVFDKDGKKKLFPDRRDAINEETAKIFEQAGQDDLAEAIRKNFSSAAGSGNGGQGNLGLVISPRLQEAFRDPVKFQKLLDEFDAKRVQKVKEAFENSKEGKKQLANAKAFKDAGAKFTQKVDDFKKLELEANLRAGNQVDPVVVSQTPQFTPEQIKQIQELENRSENALKNLALDKKEALKSANELAEGIRNGVTGKDLARLTLLDKRASGFAKISQKQLDEVAVETRALVSQLQPKNPSLVQADVIQNALDKKRKLIANDNKLPDDLPNDLPGQGRKAAGQ